MRGATRWQHRTIVAAATERQTGAHLETLQG
jgi:hypothetical protein